MTEKIFFQWQNEALRKTIYPARDMKLRHFLLYYKEIDLWVEYQNKKIEDLTKEVAEYEAAQKRAISLAFQREKSLRDYFCNPVMDLPSSSESEEMVKFSKMLKGLHDSFQVYFPQLANRSDERAKDRKEKIFVAMRITEWEQHRKEWKQRIARKRSLLAVVNQAVLDAKKKELEELENTILPRMEKEVSQLKAFVAAQNRLEKRKEDFEKRQKENVKLRDQILLELAPLWKKIELCEAVMNRSEQGITRLTKRPTVQSVLDEITKTDIYEIIRGRLTQGIVPADFSVIDTVLKIMRDIVGDEEKFDKELIQLVQPWIGRGMKDDPAWILQSLRNRAGRYQQAQTKLKSVVIALEAGLKSMRMDDPQWKHRTDVINILDDGGMLEILAEELDKLQDLQASIEYSRIDEATLAKKLSEEKTEYERIQKEIASLRQQAFPKEEQLQRVEDALLIKREMFLSTFVPEATISVRKDIVPFKAQQYNEWLEKLDHDQLLNLVYERFCSEPKRFPLWLQYMVVHFSGMRYASAHGSWADPREMLLNLRTLELQDEYRKRWNVAPEDHELDDDEIKAMCDGKIECYEPLVQGRIGVHSTSFLPQFARAAESDRSAKQRIQEYYLPRLKSENADTRRKAFLDLSIEEENYAIRTMNSEEILEELKPYEKKLPDWMWKEIVKLTDLRLSEASENWETLTVEEQNERLSNKDRQMAKYREIMNQWKEKNLTGWRQEHDRSNRLIVTRAVCNEVAEHIQHLRGHAGAAGLTQKPFWYKGAEDKYFEAKQRPPGTHPYFVRAKEKEDFKVGASILWLRFVHDIPNEWRVAKPMTTREGDGLIASKYLGRQLESGGWVYRMGEPISRTRIKMTPGSRNGTKETQWLRWMHEATVAEVAETAEGTVILTFETALPYEDPSLATIGVFKRYLPDLTNDLGEDGYNPAFVGFMPDGEPPMSDLAVMLNWDHILLKDGISHPK